MTRNLSAGDVTVESVEFTRASGIEITHAKLLFTARSKRGMIGIVRGWPPERIFDSIPGGDFYRDAQDARGAVIPPDKKHPVAWLIAFKATRVPARASPLLASYRDADGNEHTWHGSVSVKVGDCGSGS